MAQASGDSLHEYHGFFGYLTVAVCLFYYLPQTVLLLVAWIGAGASCVFVDRGHLKVYWKSPRLLIVVDSEQFTGWQQLMRWGSFNPYESKADR